MVNVDTRLPLMVQQPNILAALDAGTRAAGNANNFLRQVEGQNLFRRHGAGAMQGQQNALAAIAGYDPTVALNMQNTHLGMQATRKNMQLTDARIEEVRRQARDAARATEDKKALQIETEQGMRLLNSAAAGDARAWEYLRREFQLPDTLTPEEGLPLAGALIAGLNDELVSYNERLQGAVAGPKAAPPGNDYERYAARERAAGRVPMDEFAYRERVAVARGPETQVNVNLNEGAPTEANVGDVYNPADVVDTVRLIDQIYQSPGLERVTGPVAGGGGNDVDQMNMFQRTYYGSDGLSTIETINQLQSRAWLSARAMLKGGGPITDYESRKAEAAVARLSRTKDKGEYQKALRELREAITDGVRKLQGAGQLDASIQLPSAPYTQAVNSGESRRNANPNNRPGELSVPIDPPSAAVDLLRSDPSEEARREFDEAFGAGAADRALGR